MTVTLLDPRRATHLRTLPRTDGPVGTLDGPTPAGYARLVETTTLRRDLPSAAAALLGWRMHAATGLRVAATDVPLVTGTRVEMRLGVGPVAMRIPCVVTEAFDGPDRAGFAYATLAGHPESGVERFVLDRDDDGRTRFTVTAVARPAWAAARLAGPVFRGVQGVATRRYLTAMERA